MGEGGGIYKNFEFFSFYYIEKKFLQTILQPIFFKKYNQPLVNVKNSFCKEFFYIFQTWFVKTTFLLIYLRFKIIFTNYRVVK